ncbi:MAG: hypothetical protein RIQ93_2834 [Verrucomicrobiota bacterium]|jgi:sugar phosphate isomerase/epimerase
MQRRSFLTSLATATAALAARPALRAAGSAKAPKIALGMDNYAVRAMAWKAPELIAYAASIKCDSLLISDLDAFTSLDDSALREIRRQAAAAGVALYLGSWSICPTSGVFKTTRGSAEEHLRLGLRAAQALGSPVFRVILGNSEDRKSPGGIRARIADTITVLHACRRDILASGLQVAVENHSGDLHSWELRELIDRAGHDIVGANLDSGNAAWTLEDPLDVLETLGPVTICSSLRDEMIWETPEGAVVQWTAAGEGLIDWKRYAARWAELCPRVPMMIETISGSQRAFPYKRPEFWSHYDRRPAALAKFEALAQRGHPLPPFKAPAGPEGLKISQAYQKSELEKSLAYLRREIGLGLRA